MDNSPAGPHAAASASASDSGLLEDAKSLWHEVRGLTHDHLQLAALETKLAGKSLVTMIAAAVMVAVLLVSAWLGLSGAAVLALIESGVIASIAILLAAAVNLVIALILYYGVIRRKSRYLQFPATIRSLRPMPSGRRNAEGP